MPVARPAKRKRTKIRSVTSTRPSIAQPSAPVVVIDPDLTPLERETFLAASKNVSNVNPHVAINVARTGIASEQRSYDTKPDSARVSVPAYEAMRTGLE